MNNTKDNNCAITPSTDVRDIKSMVYVIRGRQVMLDSDLASLYQVETGALNRAVKRNIDRFPEDFCFQLTDEEFLRCQNGISSDENPRGHGGRRYLPYAFTEQGISMLSGILKSEVAISVSIGIMRAFVEMRHFIANNALLFDKISDIELKQLEYQKRTDEKFDEVFRYIEDHAEKEQKIFFDGQIYDAFSIITSIISKAFEKIILIDGYVDIDTLNILAKKNEDVVVEIYTYSNAKLTNTDIANFNAQYPTLTVKKTQAFHDRFIILDNKVAYHVGASIKDAGKKCFGISQIKDTAIINELLNRLRSV